LATSSRATEPPTVPEASATSYLVRTRVRVRARTSVKGRAKFRLRVRLRIRECHVVLALARRVAEAGGAHHDARHPARPCVRRCASHLVRVRVRG